MKLEHIGIGVKSIEAGIKIWADVFGFKLEGITEVESQKVRVAMLVRDAGEVRGVRIELIEPTSSDSPIAKFLAHRGEGLHHICFEVKSLDGVILALKEKGIRLIDESPRLGAFGKKIAFVHPSSTCGVLVELVSA